MTVTSMSTDPGQPASGGAASGHGPGATGRAQAAGEHAYPAAERAAVYRVIEERRDVRQGFLPDAVPPDVLRRVLAAAHRSPSVGLSQPWDFVVIRDPSRRQRIKVLAERGAADYAASLPGARATAFDRLKIEAILETPVNIVVTCDPTRGGRHTLGRQSQPQTAAYSSVLAVASLWLAARAEGLGVGWVSFFRERELAAELGLPAHLEVIAYLCVGYVTGFAPEPELAMQGWARRRPLAWAVHADEYGRRGMPGEDAVDLLDEVRASIGPLDQAAMAAARARQDLMTKPRGSLGVLEEVSIRLAGLAGSCPPPMPEPAAVAVFAADHGVHAQGVTPWPQEVTAQMVANFLAGGAVVNAFAAQAGAEVVVVDVGVCTDLGPVPGLLPRKIAHGTADFTAGPALAREQAQAAIMVGVEIARDLVAAGNRCLLTGDMGIANTTTSAALVCAFTGREPAEMTGRGTGIDSVTHARKVDVVRRGLARHRPDPADPIGVLAAFGGLEHAALAGFVLGAAALRVPVILDGVIAGAGALAAAAMVPGSVECCVAGHRSVEPGHAATLDHLGLRPLVDLELRLGEGTGALLALPIVQSAVRALRDVATFDSAGVTDKS
jgi:nicotinate-nucleotide--dimethylbenzimidazole phosphoribosyltransferase